MLFAKLADGRVFQVCLSQETAVQIVLFAAGLGRLSGGLTLTEQNGLEWERGK